MTRGEAIALMKITLGFRTDQDDNLITVLKAAQEKLEMGPTKPWFLLSEKATTTTTVGEQRVSLPGALLLEHEENGLRYMPADDGDPVRLRKDDLDILEDFYLLSEGSPEAYSLDGDYIRIFPIPDDAYTLEMFYYKKDDILSTDIENKWLKWAPYLLMGLAGQQIAAALRDSAAVSEFSKWEAQGRIDLYRENEARKHANTSYQIGGPH